MSVPRPDEIDDLIHGRVRLAVLSFLSTAKKAEFTLLRDTLGISDGNLSLHLKKLEEGGYVRITKDFVGKKPRTTATLTREGREALLRYIEGMKALIDRVPIK